MINFGKFKHKLALLAVLFLIVHPQSAFSTQYYKKLSEHSACYNKLMDEKIKPSKSDDIQITAALGWAVGSRDLAYAANGNLMVYKTESLLTIVDVKTYKELLTLSTDTGKSYLSTVYVSPKADRLVIARQLKEEFFSDERHEVIYTSYEIPSGRKLNTCNVVDDQGDAFATISSDGATVLAKLSSGKGFTNDNFGIVDMKTGIVSKLLPFTGKRSEYRVEVSPNGKYAAIIDGYLIEGRATDDEIEEDKKNRMIHLVDLIEKKIINKFLHPVYDDYPNFVVDDSAQIYFKRRLNFDSEESFLNSHKVDRWDGLKGTLEETTKVEILHWLVGAANKGFVLYNGDFTSSQLKIYSPDSSLKVVPMVAMERMVDVTKNNSTLGIQSLLSYSSFQQSSGALEPLQNIPLTWSLNQHSSLDLTSDSNYLLYEGKGSIKFYNFKTKQEHIYRDDLPENHTPILFSSNQTHATLGFRNWGKGRVYVDLVDLRDMSTVWKTTMLGDASSAVIGDGGTNVFIATHGGIEVREIETGTLVKQLWYPDKILSSKHLQFNSTGGLEFGVQFSLSPLEEDVMLWGKSIKDGFYRWTLKTGEVTKYSTTDVNYPLGLGFSPDGKSFYFGSKSNGNITQIDLASDQRTHYHSIQSSVEKLIDIGNEQFATVSKNGAIKIWQQGNGTELATINIFQNGEWVITTSDGYYNASENGAKYLTVKSGNQVLKIDQLHQQLYRPDLVAAKLSPSQSDIAIPDTNILQLAKVSPPELIAAGSKDDQVSQREQLFEATIRDKGHGIGKVEWRVNGLLIGLDNGERALKSKKARALEVSKTLSLSPGENVIELIAYDKTNSVSSESLTWSVTLKDAISEKPSLHILSVGINKYRDKSLWLNYAVPDAKALSARLKRAGESVFENISVHELLDNEVTKEGLTQAFDDLSQSVSTQDVFVFYLAGHGITDNGRYHFLPANFRFRNESSVGKQGVNQDDLQLWMSSVPAQKSLVLLDTCNSGSYVNAQANTRGIAEKTAIAKLTRATGRAIIAASTDTQVAFEGYQGHGVFTWALMEGLSKADSTQGNNDGITTTNELASFIDENVPEITYNKWGYEQVPQVNLLGRQFPIGLSQ